MNQEIDRLSPEYVRTLQKRTDAALSRLMPCGGIRIDDDVVVTQDGHRNRTRPNLLERNLAS